MISGGASTVSCGKASSNTWIYDPVRKKLSWRKLKLDPEAALQTSFYDQLPARDIADIFRLVNGPCNTSATALRQESRR